MPDFLARELIARATSTPDPASALGLLHAALDTDPDGKDTLLACSNWFYDHQCWSDAADAYAGYLHIESNIYYETRYSKSLLGAGHLDEAATELQNLLTKPLDESGHDFVLSQIALAYMLKGDASQALAFANQVGLGKHTLSPGAQTALMMRASARYLSGQKAKGIEDLERLYAMGPSPVVLEVKSHMQNGTFKLEPMKPFPDWYPHTVEVREGPPVEEIPDHQSDALGVGTISPDGQWRWTGSEWIDINDWVPIDQAGDSHVGMISPDGTWRWTGKAWVPFAKPVTQADPSHVVDVGAVAPALVNGNSNLAEHSDALERAAIAPVVPTELTEAIAGDVAMISADAQVMDECMAAYTANGGTSKINAIKRHRELTGLDLKSSKDAIEAELLRRGI